MQRQMEEDMFAALLRRSFRAVLENVAHERHSRVLVSLLTDWSDRGKSLHWRKSSASRFLLIAPQDRGYDPIRMKALIHLLGFVLCLTIGASSGMCSSTPALSTSTLFSLTGNVLATEFAYPPTDLTSDVSPLWTSAPDMLDAAPPGEPVIWTSAPDMLDAPLGQPVTWTSAPDVADPVPEPGTWGLVAIAFAALGVGRFRRA